MACGKSRTSFSTPMNLTHNHRLRCGKRVPVCRGSLAEDRTGNCGRPLFRSLPREVQKAKLRAGVSDRIKSR